MSQSIDELARRARATEPRAPQREPDSWANRLLTAELAPPPSPEPRGKLVPLPLRGRRFTAVAAWQPPQGGGHSLSPVPKSVELNAAQNRIENDPEPLGTATLTDELLDSCRRMALARALVAELAEALAAGLDPIVESNPRLRNETIARLLREAGAKWVELTAALELEIKQRRSGAWSSDEDEARGAEHLGAYDAPPLPPPKRPEHAPAYVAAAALVIERAYEARTFTPLAFRDPLDGKAHTVSHIPGAPPESPFGSHEADFLLARVREGHALAFVPAGTRLVPPDITAVAGAAWIGAADGSCYLLSVAD